MSTGKRTLFLSKAEWFSVVTALGIVLVAAVAWAAGGEEHVDLKAQLIDFAWRIVNFVILLFILYKLMWKKMKSFFCGPPRGDPGIPGGSRSGQGRCREEVQGV